MQTNHQLQNGRCPVGLQDLCMLRLHLCVFPCRMLKLDMVNIYMLVESDTPYMQLERSVRKDKYTD